MFEQDRLDVNNEIVRISEVRIDRSERVLQVFILDGNRDLREKGHPPFLGRTNPIELKIGMHKLEVLTQLATRCTRPRTSHPSPGLLAPEVTQVDPPYELIDEARNKS